MCEHGKLIAAIEVTPDIIRLMAAVLTYRWSDLVAQERPIIFEETAIDALGALTQTRLISFLVTHKPQPISGADMAWVLFGRRPM
jgi:hypothetical protein